MVELVIYAFVAAFIFCRLYSSFGKAPGSISLSDGYLKSSASCIDGSQCGTDDKPADLSLESVSEQDRLCEVLPVLEEFKALNKEFSAEHFITGAAAAFEVIMGALNRGDIELLSSLLRDDLCAVFKQEIERRKVAGHVHEDAVVSIVSQKVYAARMVAGVVSITVRFVTEQINIIRNDKGEIVSGSTSEINVVEDYWTFEKNADSPDRKWYLSSTKLPA